MTSVTEQTVGAVRPIVLALAPPAPGLSEGVVAPCLEAVGGARLIERLLDTLAEAGLVSPLVISSQSAAPALRALLGERARVLPSSGGRRGALALALAEADEDLLLLHDAERALTPVSVVSAVLDAVADEVDAVLPVAALTDSVKAVHAHGLRNIDRSTLAGMQSPRLLRRTLLERALAQPGRGGLEDSPAPAPAPSSTSIGWPRAARGPGARRSATTRSSPRSTSVRACERCMGRTPGSRCWIG